MCSVGLQTALKLSFCLYIKWKIPVFFNNFSLKKCKKVQFYEHVAIQINSKDLKHILSQILLQYLRHAGRQIYDRHLCWGSVTSRDFLGRAAKAERPVWITVLVVVVMDRPRPKLRSRKSTTHMSIKILPLMRWWHNTALAASTLISALVIYCEGEGDVGVFGIWANVASLWRRIFRPLGQVGSGVVVIIVAWPEAPIEFSRDRQTVAPVCRSRPLRQLDVYLFSTSL